MPANPSRPITAKDILHHLDKGFAYMPGSKDLDYGQIICLPHCTEFRDVPDNSFDDVMQYLTSLIR